MTLLELILISVGLGMDACSVAICKGLSMKNINLRKAFVIGCYFAFFQFIMPVIGYSFGTLISDNIRVYSDIIVFFLLLLLGINMFKEAFEDNEELNDNVSFKEMIIPSLATSLDALTMGITFSLLNINVFTSSAIIFVITFILSFMGTILGQIFGEKYKKKAQLLGGLILIFIGIKSII